MLQTRNGKRTAKAALQDRRRPGGRGPDRRGRGGAARRAERARPAAAPDARSRRRRATCSPRACRPRPARRSGRSCSTPTTPSSCAEPGEAVILVRVETSPEDIHGMHAAQGILTARGGMTSHAAVVARGMGKPCVAGARRVSIDIDARATLAHRRPRRSREGDVDHPRRLHRRGAWPARCRRSSPSCPATSAR